MMNTAVSRVPLKRCETIPPLADNAGALGDMVEDSTMTRVKNFLNESDARSMLWSRCMCCLAHFIP